MRNKRGRGEREKSEWEKAMERGSRRGWWEFYLDRAQYNFKLMKSAKDRHIAA